MNEASDAELLEQFALENSSSVFAVIVERHINLVYSVALRHTSDPQHAQDITQSVFIILARKAATLNRNIVLPGWLYYTARLTAANYQRSEARRIRREQRAYMQSIEASGPNPEPAWDELSPLLDEAMSRLRASDRDALVLRYFQNKTLSEVGVAMGLEERTAQKRVLRAVEKLRNFFTARGVTLSAIAITGIISANSVQAAPAALASAVTTAAITQGATATASTLTLVKGVMKVMAWTKTKITITAIAGALLVAGTTIAVDKIYVHANSKMVQRLGDGSLLALNRISFGDKHDFAPGSRTKSWSSPGHEALLLEFKLSGKNAASNLLVNPGFFRRFRGVLKGEHGIEYVLEINPNEFGKYSGDFYGYLQTGIVPRDSRWLFLRIERRDDPKSYDSWQTVANFKFPNPATFAGYQWKAAPMPATNSVAGMDLVLNDLAVETVLNFTNDIWDHHVSVVTEVRQNEVLLTNWSPAYVSGTDASGNEWFGQRHRSADPDYVWKLDMDFEPESDFSADGVATVNLPEPHSTIITNVLGVPVTISWDDQVLRAAIPTNQPNIALKYIGIADDQGDDFWYPSGGGQQFGFAWNNFMIRKGNYITAGNPTKVTFAIVPNVHTTFYAQPRLITEAAK